MQISVKDNKKTYPSSLLSLSNLYPWKIYVFIQQEFEQHLLWSTHSVPSTEYKLHESVSVSHPQRALQLSKGEEWVTPQCRHTVVNAITKESHLEGSDVLLRREDMNVSWGRNRNWLPFEEGTGCSGNSQKNGVLHFANQLEDVILK